MARRQELFLQRLEGAKERLLKVIADLDEATLTGEHIVGDWTVKDILGHLVSWDEEFRADIQAIIRGEHPGYMRLISGEDDFSQWNEGWRAQKRLWSWERLYTDLERDFLEARQLILCLRPQDYRKRGVTPWKRAAFIKPVALTAADTDSVETLVTFHWRHINQHTRMIEQWKRRNKRQGVP